MIHCFNSKALLTSGLLCGLLALALVPDISAAELPDVLAQPSVITPQAGHAVLLDITRAGKRMVAVGERGVVLLSDDNGINWRQVQVPVSTTLTAVQFVDLQNGWAVGHSGVVLHTLDAGQSWTLQLDGRRAALLEMEAAQKAVEMPGATDQMQRRLLAARQLVADGADKPFLALSFSDARHGIVVGAYGLAMRTEDGGKSWHSWMGHIPNPQSLHLYALAGSGQAFYIAGEQGLLLRSLDSGRHFERLDGPYDGTYFSLAIQDDGALLMGGLRGKAFRSRDHGDTFEALTNPVPVSLGSATRVGQQTLWVNQAGSVLRGADDSLVLQHLSMPEGLHWVDVASAPDGSLVGVGFTGSSRASMPEVNALSTIPAQAALE
ncbi:YCF48-related protein [Pseudomonas hefeiensis]|uniref:YCF48-related protein n=1 Tax=Pseudomonas hefeiensis TaxID=2738125 RepID=A0ABY9GGX0_9PSED|nr:MULTISPECIES: YCF48-related protein [unclassified Pseudomonas]WLH14746.1 YCF48-related protein [Pseudomonas sp. FP205]WLH97802.1 YCF48-related protein [Pseudomonas sp. FP53]WLI42073.1 YCF48-related protein [Pseudomonas sp. FP821]